MEGSTVDQRAIGMMLQKHVVTPLLNGTFSMSEVGLMAIALSFCHIEKNIDQTCRLCNGCDPKTLKRWESDPVIGFPKHRKDSGGKHYYYLDEVEMWKMNHPDILARVDQKRRCKE